jgi:hypothetical protein
MANKGFFKPKNPAKYKTRNGRPVGKHGIVYRSQWECSYMMKLDHDKNVTWWSSEEIIVPYTHPISGTFRRYFPDFVYEAKQKDGSSRIIMVEIKPASQCKPPKPPKGKPGKKFLNEQYRFVENQAKWASARRYCERKGWNFEVLTEKELKQWSD